jgi:hypothetical protein
MTEIEMQYRVKEALKRIKAAGLKWGQIVIEVSDGEPKHVNVTSEVIPEDPRDRGKPTRF